MPNPPEPDRDEELTEAQPLVPHDSETETVVIQPDPEGEPEATSGGQPRERRFTAPGFDAKETAIIATPPEPATEVFATPSVPPGSPGQGATPPALRRISRLPNIPRPVRKLLRHNRSRRGKA